MLTDVLRLPHQHRHGGDARLDVGRNRQAGGIDVTGVQQPIEERRLAGASLEEPGQAGPADGDSVGDPGVNATRGFKEVARQADRELRAQLLWVAADVVQTGFAPVATPGGPPG